MIWNTFATPPPSDKREESEDNGKEVRGSEKYQIFCSPLEDYYELV